MPVHQLTQTIHADDFHDKVYRFPIDSVLHTETEPEKLVISASAGYLLSSPTTEQPRRELSVPYQQQPDGSWAAHSVITLMGCEKELTNGLVRIQNALTGTTILTIQAESTALAPAPAPRLTVSESVLTFPSTSPGTPKFAVLTIAQQHANELITISSDAPDYFQLASDKHPNFSHTLTLQPTPMGTYVHVRYLANKSGRHEGQLSIRSSYDEKAVALQGRSASLLPVVRPARPAYAKPERSDSSGRIKKAAVVVGSVLVVGLAWLGYTYRTSSEEITAPANQSVRSVPVVPPAAEPFNEAASKPLEVPRTKNRRPANQQLVEPSPATEPVVRAEQPPTQSARSTELTVQKPTTQKKEEESDLEKVLNQSPPD